MTTVAHRQQPVLVDADNLNMIINRAFPSTDQRPLPVSVETIAKDFAAAFPGTRNPKNSMSEQTLYSLDLSSIVIDEDEDGGFGFTATAEATSTQFRGSPISLGSMTFAGHYDCFGKLDWIDHVE